MKWMKSLLLLTSLIVSTASIAQLETQKFQVNLLGVNDEIAENIRTNLTVLLQDVDENDFNEQTEDYRARIEQETQNALQPFGYYQANVDVQIIRTDRIQLKIMIGLNRPIRITGLSFKLTGEGANNPDFSDLLTLFPLQKGDIFVHSCYEQGKKAMLTLAIQKGFLNAQYVEHQVDVDLDEYTCHIYLVLDTKERHYFGPVTFDTSALSNKLLQRYVPFQIGEIYAPEKLLVLQSRLSQSDYFTQVNVKTTNSDEPLLVPIRVELTDAKPNQYTIGAGYGTDTGPRGKLSWTRRRINSLGHRLSVQARIAEIYNKIEIDYIIPGQQPSTDRIKINGGFFEDEYSEKQSRIHEIGISEERFIHGWNRKLTLSYMNEKYNAFITNAPIQSKLFLPSLTLVQTKRDDKTNPTHGRRIEFTLRGSVDTLFSDTSFFQSYLLLRWLKSFSETTKGILRLEFGATFPDSVEDLPLSQRFFAGGDYSIRGFAYRSLPFEIDKDGERHPVGGTYLAVGSIELNQTIRKPFGVFTFVDAGNAFRKNDNEIEIGAGVGIEWQTRLGPLKLALAKPITLNGDTWRIHANFGPEI